MFTSIKSRMAVYVVITVTALLLLMGFYNYQSKAQALEQQLQGQARLVANRLSLSLPNFIWNFDQFCTFTHYISFFNPSSSIYIIFDCTPLTILYYEVFSPLVKNSRDKFLVLKVFYFLDNLFG